MPLTPADIEYFAAAMNTTRLTRLRQMRQCLEEELARRVKITFQRAMQNYDLNQAEAVYIHRLLVDCQATQVSAEQSSLRRKFDILSKLSPHRIRQDLCRAVTDVVSRQLRGI